MENAAEEAMLRILATTGPLGAREFYEAVVLVRPRLSPGSFDVKIRSLMTSGFITRSKDDIYEATEDGRSEVLVGGDITKVQLDPKLKRSEQYILNMLSAAGDWMLRSDLYLMVTDAHRFISLPRFNRALADLDSRGYIIIEDDRVCLAVVDERGNAITWKK